MSRNFEMHLKFLLDDSCITGFRMHNAQICFTLPCKYDVWSILHKTIFHFVNDSHVGKENETIQ